MRTQQDLVSYGRAPQNKKTQDMVSTCHNIYDYEYMCAVNLSNQQEERTCSSFIHLLGVLYMNTLLSFSNDKRCLDFFFFFKFISIQMKIRMRKKNTRCSFYILSFLGL
jgi:hypothetical protein